VYFAGEGSTRIFLIGFDQILLCTQRLAQSKTGGAYDWAAICKRITASGRPHRCCHLTNNFDARRTFPVHVLQLGREMPPIAPFPVGDPDPHLMYVSFDPPKSTTQKASRLVHRFSTALGCDQQMHRHTDTAHCDS